MFTKDIKAIIFDFDGTIVDSNSIKEAAFYEIFLKFGEKVALIGSNYHKINPGVNRLEKFRYIINNFTDLAYNDDLGQELSNDFSKIVLKNMKESKYINYAEEFLRKFHNVCMFFISSAMPESELVEITKDKGIYELFYEMKGYPTSKSDYIGEVIRSFNFKSEEVIFVGDAQSDYDAAYMNSINFICIGNSGIKGSIFEQINNYNELEKILGWS